MALDSNKIVEEIELRLESSKAEQAAQKFGKAFDESMKGAESRAGSTAAAAAKVTDAIERQYVAGDKLAEQIYALDKRYDELVGSMKRLAGAGDDVTEGMAKQAAAIRKARDALAEQQQTSKESNKMFEKFKMGGLAAVAWTMAINELKKALEAARQQFLESVKPAEDLGKEWDTGSMRLASMRDYLASPEWKDHNLVVNALMLGYRAWNTQLAETENFIANMKKDVEFRDKNREQIFAEIDRSLEGLDTSSMFGKGGLAAFKAKAKAAAKARLEARRKAEKEALKEYVAAQGPDTIQDDLTADLARNTEHALAVQDALVSIEQGKADRILAINNKMAADLKAAQERDAAEQLAIHQMYTDAALGVTQNMVQASLDALAAWASGQEVSLQQVVKGFLANQGRMLAGQGTSDVFKGLSRALSSYGLDPTATGLLTLGGSELAAGIAMIGGSLAFPPGRGGGGAGGAGRAHGGGSRGFSGGSVQAQSGSGGGDKIINITVNGAVTSAEAGVQINRALSEASKQGLI